MVAILHKYQMILKPQNKKKNKNNYIKENVMNIKALVLLDNLRSSFIYSFSEKKIYKYFLRSSWPRAIIFDCKHDCYEVESL